MRTYRVEIVVHVTKYHGIHGAVYLTWYSTVCCPKIPWYFYYVIAFEALYCGRGRYFCHCIFPGRPWRPLCYAGIGSCVNGCTEVHWKAAFHFSTQLQTWSQAGRKHVESQLRTCLKRVFFYTFHLSARARTSEHVAVRDQDFHKKSRKLVVSMSQTRMNLSKTWL